MRHKPKLKEIHREFLVRELACYSTPEEAAQALKERFGIEITRQTAESYDPNKKQGSKKWRTLFDEHRKKFRENLDDSLPIANKAFRLKKIAKVAAAFEGTKNYIGVLTALEHAAKECGNVHTNRRELTGKDGGPVQHEEIGMMTDEQVKDELRALRAQGRKARLALAATAVEDQAPPA